MKHLEFEELCITSNTSSSAISLIVSRRSERAKLLIFAVHNENVSEIYLEQDLLRFAWMSSMV